MRVIGTTKRNRIYTASIEFKLLKRWQAKTFKSETRPTVEDIKVFLLLERQYEKKHIECLKKWTNTRYKREFLTTVQIKDWYEFYYD